MPELCAGVADQAHDSFPVGDVDLDRSSLPAALCDTLGNLPGGIPLDIGDDDSGTAAGEFDTEGATKPHASAGDDCDFVFEIVHGVVL
jgi:hypothetical protein